MNTFGTAELNTLRLEINQALEIISKKHSINLEIGKMSYTNEDFSVTLKGITQRALVNQGIINARIAGVSTDIIGTKFYWKNKQYIVTSITSKKYPIEVKRLSDNAHFNLSTELYKSCL